MLAMIDDAKRPGWVDPKTFSPFVIVGEPAKPSELTTVCALPCLLLLHE
jgi:hypothetical protein